MYIVLPISAALKFNPEGQVSVVVPAVIEHPPLFPFALPVAPKQVLALIGPVPEHRIFTVNDVPGACVIVCERLGFEMTAGGDITTDQADGLVDGV
jgi:hypothetical protein